MITDEQVEAAKAAFTECAGDELNAAWRAALLASERAAWRPVIEADQSSEFMLAQFEASPSVPIPARPIGHYSDMWEYFVGGICPVAPVRFRPLPTPPHEGEK